MTVKVCGAGFTRIRSVWATEEQRRLSLTLPPSFSRTFLSLSFLPVPQVQVLNLYLL